MEVGAPDGGGDPVCSEAQGHRSYHVLGSDTGLAQGLAEIAQDVPHPFGDILRGAFPWGMRGAGEACHTGESTLLEPHRYAGSKNMCFASIGSLY